MCRKFILITLIMLTLGTIDRPMIGMADEPGIINGPPSDKILFQSFHVDRAPIEIQQHNMDLYLYGIRPDASEALKDDETVVIYKAPASSISLILNPAPASQGELNPFSIKKVRQALQFLIDREFVAGNIYRGQALPMITHISPLDFDYLTLYQELLENPIQYNPELGNRMIKEAMLENGAQLTDGIWHYKNHPIKIKFVIRVEDERRDVGDLLRNSLQKAGFDVAPIYQNFAPAIQTVYSSNPSSLEWHIYTEGWSRSSPDRYDFSNINQMTAPWMGNMPGWKASGFWQYENAELDNLGKNLFTGQFSTKDERDQFYKEATLIALDESVRIWISTVLNSFPASGKLNDLTEDLVAGPRSPWSLREAYIPGSNQLTVGNLWVWTERTTWNPLGGFSDVYSQDIWRNINDPPIWNHPFSGIPIPFRSNFSVETKGGEHKIEVPSSAVRLDPLTDTWVPVSNGTKATSKVTFDYSKFFQSKWHHGVQISMADVVYSIFQNFDIAFDPEKAKIETSIAMTSKPFLDTFKGFRVLDENRLEVYVDYWHFEESYIASYANPTSLSTPWEILYAMDRVVFQDRQGAYSDTAASRFNVPWLSLVMGRDARLIKNQLTKLNEQNTNLSNIFSINGFNLSNNKSQKERINAGLNWWDKFGILVIGNGPYQLTRFDPPAQFAELEAFRDPSYPFSPGKWQFGAPERPEIWNVDSNSLRKGEPFELSFDFTGPGNLQSNYFLTDPSSGETVTIGSAMQNNSGGFELTIDKSITENLSSSMYHLHLVGFSDQISLLSEYRVDLPTDEESALRSNYESTNVDLPPESPSGCGKNASNDLGVMIGGLALFKLATIRKKGQQDVDDQSS